MSRRKLSKQETEVVEELQDTSGENYGSVLIVDNYARKNSPAIQNVRSAVEDAGYKPEVIRHSEANKVVKSGDDFSEGYDAVLTSGSGGTWKKNTGKDKKGRTYVSRKDAVHEQLSKQGKPVYAICGGGHAIAEALGHEIVDTGKFHKGEEDGNFYNHKYAVPAEGLGNKVKHLKTLEHQEEEYADSFEQGNIRFVQHHTEKTENGRKDIAAFLKQYVPRGKKRLGDLVNGPPANENYGPVQYEKAA
ncbi:hypothetical protein CMO94_03585 [Candidatus Woesearchaeota archaeon]|jgi:anthranilate/para-aminobenzoate synthase component II|nr:hypothetical protein [Candidatus Woesearchaeota archaeon]|tara:strand:+ start:534 stop:1274 length:741 start_codon:yes stop_codon:yes gene_type:complete